MKVFELNGPLELFLVDDYIYYPSCKIIRILAKKSDIVLFFCSGPNIPSNLLKQEWDALQSRKETIFWQVITICNYISLYVTIYHYL